jgi:hypothetical protein
MIYSWVFMVGGGVLMIALWPGLESLGPWIAAAVYIIVYGLTMQWRFAAGRWRSIRLLDEPEARTGMGTVIAGPEIADAPAAVSEAHEP